MRLPPSSDSRWALAWLLGLLVVLLLLMAGPRASGQSVSPQGPPSLSASLSEAERMLMQLVTRLAERQKQVADLQASLTQADAKLSDLAASLATLREQLEAAQASLQQSRTDLAETLTLLDALSRRYEALEASWNAYRSEMVTQVADLTRDYQRAKRWAVGCGVSTGVGFLLCLLLVLL